MTALTFVLIQALVLLMWLAWFGRTFARFELSSLGALDVPHEGDLGAVADEAEALGKGSRALWERQNKVNRVILRRLEELTGHTEGTGDRVEGDR